MSWSLSGNSHRFDRDSVAIMMDGGVACIGSGDSVDEICCSSRCQACIRGSTGDRSQGRERWSVGFVVE